MAGKPAARMGDMASTCNDPADLPVGTVQAAGTVLIEGMPAAKQGDKIVGADYHFVMVPAPPSPSPVPQLLPHSYAGSIKIGCVPTVKIVGMPAAVVGSEAMNDVPHTPTPPGTMFQKLPTNKAKIMMGAKKVFIGSGGGGGGGGGSGSASGKDGIIDRDATPTGEAEGEGQQYLLDCAFVDKNEKAIAGRGFTMEGPGISEDGAHVSGPITKNVPEKGEYKGIVWGITKVAWSKDSVKKGEEVQLQVETASLDDGTHIKLEVWERDINCTDRLVGHFPEVKVEGDKAEVDWVCDAPGNEAGASEGGGCSNPDYYFTASIGHYRMKSSILSCLSTADLKLIDAKDEPVANKDVILRLCTGELKQGKTNDDGTITIEDIPPRGLRSEITVLKDEE